ncbi:hypothetical protein glysoja_032382, partial [Glycine soja]
IAIYHGLSKAWDDGFCFVTCESDSQMALDLICDPPTTFHPHLCLIHLIKNMMDRDGSLVFKTTLRE